MQMKQERLEYYNHWREVMKDFEASGLSQSKYCELKNISYRKFKYYRYQINKSSKPPTPEFAPIKIAASTSPNQASFGSYKIQLQNGIRCEIPLDYQETSLTHLLGVLIRCG